MRTGRGRRGSPGRVIVKVLVALGVAALAFVGWRVGTSDSASEVGPEAASAAGSAWFDVRPMSFDLTVASSGELEAGRQIEIKSRVEGVTTITEIVPEGTVVDTGDILVRLANDDIMEKVEQERLNVEQARTDHVAAEQDLAIQQSEADESLRASELKLELARLELEKWKRGDDPKRVRELGLALQKAERNLERAVESRDLSEQLYKEDFISKSELDDDRLKVVEAEAALETAKLDIQVHREYVQPMERKRRVSDVEQAEAELERTARRNDSRMAQAQARLAGRVRSLRIRELRLAKMNEQLEATVIRAPQEGLVVYGTTVGAARRRGEPIAQGRQVRLNETIIVLPDTARMVARLRVHEALVSRVAIGQRVVLHVDAQPQDPIEGVVSEIGVMAEDGGWMNPDLREYSVRVDLPPQVDQRWKPAMRCMGRVFLGRAEDVNAVPIQAVFSEGRQRYCYIPAADGRVRRQAVRIGRANETHVEVTAGLEDVARVLLRRPRANELAPGDERMVLPPPTEVADSKATPDQPAAAVVSR